MKFLKKTYLEFYLKSEHNTHTTFGFILILINTNGIAKSIIMIDPMKIYIIFIVSIIIPPIIVPINIDKLYINKNRPFANSGASLTDDVTQYCEIVHAEPSNIPKINNIRNSKNGILTIAPI